MTRCFKDGEGDGGGGGLGGGTGDWRAAIPEQLRNDAGLKDFKDVGSLAKSYLETKQLVGSSLRPPGPDASPEAKREFAERLRDKVPNLVVVPEDEKELEAFEADLWRRLGKPKDAKEYSLDGLNIEGADQLSVDELRQTAAALGMTKKQFASYAKGLAAVRLEAAQVQKANMAALKQEWGAAHGERVEAILAAAVKLDVDADTLKAIKGGVLTPTQMKSWWSIAKALGSEPGEGRQQVGGGTGMLAREEALQRAAEIRDRPEYWDAGKNPALHKELVAKHAKFMEMAYAE